MRNFKWKVSILPSALALLFLGMQASATPSPGLQSQNEQTTKKETKQESGVYRVSYKVNELENGKIINSRSYTLMAKVGEREAVNIGSRIPVAFQGKLDYHTVGMALSCIIRQGGEKLVLHSEFNLNTIADKQPASVLPPPVTRQFYLQDDAVAPLGKSAFVGSIDDISSNRRYVIEVTVTKAN